MDAIKVYSGDFDSKALQLGRHDHRSRASAENLADNHSIVAEMQK